MTDRRTLRTTALLATTAALLLQGAPAGAGEPGQPAPLTFSIVYSFESQPEGSPDFTYDGPVGSRWKQPIIGDFVGDSSTNGGLDDILWYQPGPQEEVLTRTNGDITSSRARVPSVNGTYQPLVGHFGDDDGKEDILWYAPGKANDSLWDFNADGSITKIPVRIDGTYLPVLGNFDRDLGTDIIWYGAGSNRPDALWRFDGRGGRTAHPLRVDGTYTPVVGRFGGTDPALDGGDDVFWYAPGRTADALWDFDGLGGRAEVTMRVNGTYTPLAGDFTGDGYGDIFWYGRGTVADSIWDFRGPLGEYRTVQQSVDGWYQPVAGEIFEQGAHLTDIVWFAPGGAADEVWDHQVAGQPPRKVPVTLNGNRVPLLARFYAYDDGDALREGADLMDRFIPT